MKFGKILALSALILPVGTIAGCSHPQPVVVVAPPPPPAFGPVAQQGYHDGIEAARRDIRAGFAPACSVTRASAIRPSARLRNIAVASAPDMMRRFGVDLRLPATETLALLTQIRGIAPIARRTCNPTTTSQMC